jgi:peptidoglycan-associated lipoprotein
LRRISAILATLGAAALLSACPPPKVYPNCDSDQQCKTEGRNESCVQGQCVECQDNAQCQAGFACQNNRCVPPTECAPDRPCANGGQCTAEGKCVQCQADTDCPNNGLCRDNACTARPEGYCAQAGDCGTGEDCQANRCVKAAPQGAAACAGQLQPVQFGFNESALASLAPEQRQRLDAAAQCLKQGGAKVTLEGHADERGTDEYNLQLSEKRAASVKRYLTQLGVQAADLETVGYGENRPAQEGAGEDAFAANRRVEFTVR